MVRSQGNPDEEPFLYGFVCVVSHCSFDLNKSHIRHIWKVFHRYEYVYEYSNMVFYLLKIHKGHIYMDIEFAFNNFNQNFYHIYDEGSVDQNRSFKDRVRPPPLGSNDQK